MPSTLWERIEQRYPAWRREQYPEAGEITDAEWRDLYRALDAGVESWIDWNPSAYSSATDRARVIEDLKEVALEVMAQHADKRPPA